MKRKINVLASFALIVFSICWATSAVIAQSQNSDVKTNTRMIYHDGAVETFNNVYLIWYGCWSESCGNVGSEAARQILTDFVSSLGPTPYFQINATYANSSGQQPGNLNYYRSETDPAYRRGVELTDSDIRGVVSDSISYGDLPVDPTGIYIVLSSPDVGSTATGFCTEENTPPHHGSTDIFLRTIRYGFVGDPKRCPALESPQFVGARGRLLPAPNDNLTADAMAAKLAHVLSTIVTDPFGDAWYDKFGLENADKCQGKFGDTYTTANGARANVLVGQRDFLLSQNWLNDNHGRCSLSQ
jgi:hypothetical protein